MNFKKAYRTIFKKIKKNKKNNGCFYFRGNLLDLGRCIGVYALVLGYNKNSLTNNIFFFTNHNMVIFSSLNHQEHNRLRIKAFHVKMTQTLSWALNRVGTSIYCNMKVLLFCKFRNIPYVNFTPTHLYYIPIQENRKNNVRNSNRPIVQLLAPQYTYNS